VIAAIKRLLNHDTAGDPIRDLKWTRRTTRKVAEQLKRLKIHVSATTVGRLLKGMRYSLRVNRKRLECGGKNPPPRKVRDRQFKYISHMRKKFNRSGKPVISGDAKKKEQVGNFKNPGASWEKHPYEVNDHDFPSHALGKAVPYSVYDTGANFGFVLVGVSHETPAFAVRAIVLWWLMYGRKMYADAKELLILVDSGGGNGWRSRAWKYHIQRDLCDRYGLTVTICHYPPGASKWNPADHRLHSEISKNWAGKPLRSYETILKYIRTTKTKTGLRVRSRLESRFYAKGERITDSQMAELCITRHKTNPDWNYTLTPHRLSKM
jgi:hypothetical protein